MLSVLLCNSEAITILQALWKEWLAQVFAQANACTYIKTSSSWDYLC